MPIMLRPMGKATKIARKVMGKPINLQDNRTPRDRWIDKRLVFDETSRVK